MSLKYFIARRLTKPAYRITGIGLGRICEYVRRYAAMHGPSEPLQIQDFRGNLKFNCFLREHMGGQIFFRGSYSWDQLLILEKILKPNSVFIDGGANQGEFSIAAAKIISKGKIISFEPVAEYRDRLLENIKINGFQNIQVLPIALGDQEGTLPIYGHKKAYADGTTHEGLLTLYSSSDRETMVGNVLVRRLDDILAELRIGVVDVVKLDIEGAEWSALRGATELLVRCRPILIVEIGRKTCEAAGYQPEDFAEWITENNYRIEKILGGGKTQAITPGQLSSWQNIIAFPQ